MGTTRTSAQQSAEGGSDTSEAVRAIDAIKRLTDARLVLAWGSRGDVLANSEWDGEMGPVDRARAALRGHDAIEVFTRDDAVFEGIAGAADCGELVLLPLEGDRVQMLLGVARSGALESIDVEALLPLASAALRPVFGVAFDSAQLTTVREIVSGVGHDVGTPLNVISGYSEYLLMSLADDAKGRKEIAAILEQTRRVAQMIQQLLDVVRTQPGEAGRTRPLSALCEESLHLATYMLRKAQVKSRIEGEISEKATVTGKLSLLYQAIFNVLASAAGVAGHGGSLVIRPVTGETGTGLEIEALSASGERCDLGDLAEPAKLDGDRDYFGLIFARSVLAEHGGDVLAMSEEPNAARLFVRFGE